MRVLVTLQNILEYGLDTLTGNSRTDLLARAAELEREGFELYVKIPDVQGGDIEAPTERNTFDHYGPDLPDPEGVAHKQEALNLAELAYLDNPCGYSLVDEEFICDLHQQPSKFAVDLDSHAPCIEVAP